jgi:phosphoheptose isomerase
VRGSGATFSRHAAAAARAADDQELHASLEEAAALIRRSLARGGAVLCAGNGGSATAADHLAAELVGRLRTDRGPWRAASLSTSPAIATALSNDYGFEQALARQVTAMARPGDVLVLFTSSGRSENLIAAAAAATAVDCRVVGCTGADAGPLGPRCDIVVRMPTSDPLVAQELHGVALHAMVELLEASGQGTAAEGARDDVELSRTL